MMEQLQNNVMLLELVQRMAQQSVAKTGVESTQSSKSEPSEFQKELEQQTQAVRNESKPAETEKVEKTEQADKPVQDEASMEQELQNAQELARQAAQAGLIWADTGAVVADQPVVAAETATEVQTVTLASAVVAEEAPVQQVVQNAQTVQNAQNVQPEAAVAQAEESADVQTQTVSPAQNTEQSDVGENSRMNSELTSRQTVQTQSAEQQEQDEVQVTDVETGPETIFHDVKEVMIKVAEAPATEAGSETGGLEDQITEKLTEALNLGESRVEIQLTPESLGSVTVELTRSGDGTLSIILNAESSRTQSLLEKHSVGLQEFLMNNGQERVQIEVNNAQESQYRQQDFADGHNGGQEGRQQEQRQEQPDAQDFMQQLRLGLVSVDGAAS